MNVASSYTAHGYTSTRAKKNTERGFENGTGKLERHQTGNRSNAGNSRKAGRNLPRSARQELRKENSNDEIMEHTGPDQRST